MKNKVRIIKVDDRNYCVQKYATVKGRDKAGNDTTRQEWVDAGYYGEHLRWAVESALMAAVPEGKSLLGEFKEACKSITAETIKAINEVNE